MTRPDVSVVVINKDEPELAQTLEALAAHESATSREVVVIDASRGRLDHLRIAHPDVVWVDFEPTPGVVTIPEQRNRGVRTARADVVVFTDASCLPEPGWLDRLTAPIRSGAEEVVVGATHNRGEGSLYHPEADTKRYVQECATNNLAFTRRAYDLVGGFDESFSYGSDIDFSWRLRRIGIRLRYEPTAVVSHHWGGRSRQLKRAFQYGEGRARLYATNPWRIRTGLTQDPTTFVYPAVVAALPLTVVPRLRWLPLVLAVPLWRNRRKKPFLTVANHLAYGAGALSFVARAATDRP